jgi:hypothetical protein
MLDEAIREHLELKRSRGADPIRSDVEAAEALEPMFPEEADAGDREEPEAPVAEVEEQHAAEGAAEPLLAEQLPLAAAHPPDAAPEFSTLDVATPAADPSPLSDFSSVGQETAELDMDALLAEEGEELPSEPG